MRDVRIETGNVRTELRDEVQAGFKEVRDVRSDLGDVRTEIGTVRTGRDRDRERRTEIRTEIGNLRTEIRTEIGNVRTEIGNLRTELRDEMQAGFKELTARVVNIGDRLSKVEGIIEGMFWGSRNRPPDKPRQGAA